MYGHLLFPIVACLGMLQVLATILSMSLLLKFPFIQSHFTLVMIFSLVAGTVLGGFEFQVAIDHIRWPLPVTTTQGAPPLFELKRRPGTMFYILAMFIAYFMIPFPFRGGMEWMGQVAMIGLFPHSVWLGVMAWVGLLTTGISAAMTDRHYFVGSLVGVAILWITCIIRFFAADFTFPFIFWVTAFMLVPFASLSSIYFACIISAINVFNEELRTSSRVR